MQKTNDLISALQSDLKPTKKLWPLGLQFILWVILSFTVTFLSFLFFDWKIHPELITDRLSLSIEFVSIFILIGFSVYSALVLSRPDRGQLAKVLLLITVVLWFITFSWFIIDGPEFGSFGSLLDHLTYACFRTVMLLGILPSLFLFFMVRRGASTQLAWASFASALAGSAIGYAAIRVECVYQDPYHILMTHVLPMMFILAFGFFLGRKLLRW